MMNIHKELPLSFPGCPPSPDPSPPFTQISRHYLPGHGEVSTREDVVEFRDMVMTVKDRVAALVANGASYDDVAAARPTAEWEARWGDPQRFLTAVYAELAGTE